MNNDIEKELKELQIQYDKVLKERNELEKENILLKKDLEVLNIIKRSITHKEKHTHELNEKLKGQKYMNISVWINGDTDFNKVKDWLENDKR